MEKAIDEFNRSKGKVMDDFRTIVTDADKLLHATAKISGEGFNIARADFSDKLKTAKASLDDAEKLVIENAKLFAKSTDVYVKANPWTVVGIAAGLGLLIGFIAAKR